MAGLENLVARATELGHVVDVQRRDFPEYDVPPKFYLTCACGWKFGHQVRTETNAIRLVVFHLGKAVGEADGIPSLKNLRSVDPALLTKVAAAC